MSAINVLGEFQQGTARFQAGSVTMSRVMSALLDTLARNNIPDSPEGL